MSLYKAQYNFQAQDENALSFSCGEEFAVLETKDVHWWLVKNKEGQIGFVPANYLLRSDHGKESILQSIDRGIRAIHEEIKRNGGKITENQRIKIQKLEQHRKNVLADEPVSPTLPVSPVSQNFPDSPKLSRPASSKGPAPVSPVSPSQEIPTSPGIARASSSKGPAPPPPPVRHSSIEASSQPVVKAEVPSSRSKRSAPDPPSKHISSHSSIEEVGDSDYMLPVSQPVSIPSAGGHRSHRASKPAHSSVDGLCESPHAASSGSGRYPGSPTKFIGSPGKGGMALPKGLAEDLVELVRRNTDLSVEKSRTAVSTVLAHLRDHLPSVQGMMDDILQEVKQKRSSELTKSHDAEQLQYLLEELTACKDDSQQRSWALHEDEDIILNYLQEMWSILTNADPTICNAVLLQDHYSAIHNLVLYYQMETRVSIRMVLLRVFGTLCALDKRIISEFLTSVLPLELARDMQHDSGDVNKFKHSALVLSMIFCMGETVPIHHYDHLSRHFISFLMDSIEEADDWLPPDEHDTVLDLLLNLILAFNLHFEMPSENPIMNDLGSKGTAKVFTEKLLMLFNRGDDPVRMFDHLPKPPHSLLKFMTDLFSRPDTANIFYTNDAKVLLDIVIRMITDLSPGDKVRTEYLSLTHLILKNSDYIEHQHRLQDFTRVFQSIASEHGEDDSEMDKDIVNEICKDFPDLFQQSWC